MKVASPKSFWVSEDKNRDVGRFVAAHNRLYKLGSNVGVVGCHPLSHLMNRV